MQSVALQTALCGGPGRDLIPARAVQTLVVLPCFFSFLIDIPIPECVTRVCTGIAGAVIFVILLVLLVWMICVRATKRKTNEKAQLGPGAEVAHR